MQAAPRWTRLRRAAVHDLRVGALRTQPIRDADVMIGVARRIITERSSAADFDCGGPVTVPTLLNLIDVGVRAMGAELAVSADAAAAYRRLDLMLGRRLDEAQAAPAGAVTAGGSGSSYDLSAVWPTRRRNSSPDARRPRQPSS
jgi:hypothetical protein